MAARTSFVIGVSRGFSFALAEIVHDRRGLCYVQIAAADTGLRAKKCRNLFRIAASVFSYRRNIWPDVAAANRS
jgi:hypothetical protein